MTHPAEVNNILETARAMADAAAGKSVFDLAGTPAVVVPEGYALNLFGDLRERPARLKQTVWADTLEAWLAYWERFADADSTAFFSAEAGMLTGVLDYHQSWDRDSTSPSGGQPMPRHGDHRIKYRFPKTAEWQNWERHNGKRMSQADFALFIEDVVPDIVHPSGADMLEIVTTLQAKTNINFASATRLDNGQTQFVYQEDIKGSAGAKGTLTIPQTIQIGLRLFHGCDAYQMEARFRYRIVGGALELWYDLVRPERVREAILNDVYIKARDGMTVGHILHGYEFD